MALPSFVIPPGEKGIERRRRLAEVLAEQGTSTAPVQSWTQGAARVAQSLASVLGNYQANQMEQQRTSALQQALSSGATPEQLMGSGDQQLMQFGQFKALERQRQEAIAHQQRVEDRQTAQDTLQNRHWDQNFAQQAANHADTVARADASAARADAAAARQPPATRQVTQPDGSQTMEQYDPASGTWSPAKITGGSAAPANPNAAIPVPKLTEGEQKSFRYYRRARNAQKALSPAEEEALASGAQNSVEWAKATFDKLPYGLGTAASGLSNAAHSDAYQKARVHADRIIASLNYSDSGASMHQDEYVRQWDALIPKFGNGPDVIAEKRKARADAISSLRATTGRGQATLDREEQAYAEADASIAALPPENREEGRKRVKQHLQSLGYDAENY